MRSEPKTPRPLLKPWAQLRIFFEFLGGRLQYGAARGYAAGSLARLVFNVPVIVLVGLGLFWHQVTLERSRDDLLRAVLSDCLRATNTVVSAACSRIVEYLAKGDIETIRSFVEAVDDADMEQVPYLAEGLYGAVGQLEEAKLIGLSAALDIEQTSAVADRIWDRVISDPAGQSTHLLIATIAALDRVTSPSKLADRIVAFESASRFIFRYPVPRDDAMTPIARYLDPQTAAITNWIVRRRSRCQDRQGNLAVGRALQRGCSRCRPKLT